MNNLYMHESTYRKLVEDPEKYNLGNKMVYYSGDKISYNGTKIIISNHMKPTTKKEVGWIFPKTPFIIYEESDIDYCRYAGIGRPKTETVMGEIYQIDESKLAFTEPMKLNVSETPQKRHHIYKPQNYIMS